MMKISDKRLEALQEELAAQCGELEARTKESEDLRNQLLRLRADFDNAQRRWVKEQAQSQEQANRQILTELLEIHDDFERAMANCPSTGSERAGEPALSEVEGFRTGVEMIGKRLESFLKSYGVTPMEAEGKPFDPSEHEAVAHEESDQVPESTVLAELKRGYRMNGKVLRHAVVKVSVKGSDPCEASSDCKGV